MPSEDAEPYAWNIGLANADITPTEPIRMGGYGGRVEPSEGVADPLMAKAMALEDGEGHRAVLVTTDVISFDAPFAETVFEAITRRTGLPRDCVVINSSHTHAGPIFGVKYPGGWDLTSEQADTVAAYTDTVRERVVGLVAAALDDLRPATLAWATGVCSTAMSRRKPTPQGVRNAPNPRGYADRSVPVLRVAEADGSLRAVLFGYACHNTTMGGDNLRISADYAGFAQRLVERETDAAQATFLMGCGADANPYPRGTYELARHHGEGLGAEVCRVLADADFEPIRGPLRIAFGHADLPLEPQPSPEQIDALRQKGGWNARVADRIQARIDTGEPWATVYRTPVAVWQFGEDLTLVRLSGEVVSDYIRLIERELGPLDLWIAAYCADYFGYLPSARVHAEGGYEAHSFITGHGYLAAGAEPAILATIRQLAQRAGRPMPVRH